MARAEPGLALAPREKLHLLQETGLDALEHGPLLGVGLVILPREVRHPLRETLLVILYGVARVRLGGARERPRDLVLVDVACTILIQHLHDVLDIVWAWIQPDANHVL